MIRFRTIILFGSLIAVPVHAQTRDVEVDPIQCWWRTTAAGVRVGEPFSIVLTCSVLQTDAARAVVDESRLDPAVVQFPPFDVLGGARADDLETAGRRLIQYEYRLRAIAENVFGVDVVVPPLQLSYRIESRVGGNESTTGRELAYVLPPLPIRVVSVVPDTAMDIREAPAPTFNEIGGVAFRGTVMRVAAWILFACAALVGAIALAGVVRRRRAAAPKTGRVLPDAAVLQGLRRELTAVQEAARASGWTADLVGRALAALRIAAAYASGRPVSQMPGKAAVDGQLALASRFGGSAVVSSATANGGGELEDGLAAFTAARYGRNSTIDGSKLDDAVADGIRVVDRLAADRPLVERLWAR